MTSTPAQPAAGTSTRPYLIRALHDWCTDNGFTPYIAVFVDASVQVPMEYVKNNEIVLNIGFEATTSLQLGNELVEFKARFGGVSREIRVPVEAHIFATGGHGFNMGQRSKLKAVNTWPQRLADWLGDSGLLGEVAQAFRPADCSRSAGLQACRQPRASGASLIASGGREASLVGSWTSDCGLRTSDCGRGRPAHPGPPHFRTSALRDSGTSALQHISSLRSVAPVRNRTGGCSCLPGVALLCP